MTDIEHQEGEELPIDRFPKLQRARDIFVQLFQTDMPLVNLGYTRRQILTVVPVLSLMERKGIVDPYIEEVAYFEEGQEPKEDDDGEDYPYPSFDVEKFVELRLTKDDCSRIHAYGSVSDEGFFPGQIEAASVAIINLLPEELDINNIDEIVKHLYQDFSGVGDVNLQRGNALVNAVSFFLGGIKQFYQDVSEVRNGKLHERKMLTNNVSSQLPDFATYRAAWTDPETKMELVVETNFMNKTYSKFASNIPHESEIHIWRRLPIQTVKGKKWIPFGRKPNMNKEVLTQVFEAKKSVAVAGRLVNVSESI